MTVQRISRVIVCFSMWLVSGCAIPSAPTGIPPTPAPATIQPATLISPASTQDPFTEARLEMVKETIEARGVANPDVLQVMRMIPRHAFVPPD